jgi:tetratricopeptide (TPR) repeat protein
MKARAISFLTSSFCIWAAVGSLTLATAEPAWAQRNRGDRDRGGGGGDEDDTEVNVATIVFLTGVTQEDVIVTQTNYGRDGIQVQEGRRGRPRGINGDEVKEIRWKNPPSAFGSGVNQLRAGLYERAATSFTQALANAQAAPWLSTFATFYLAEAQRGMGSNDEAIGNYNRIIEGSPDHWLFPAAIHGLGYAQLGAGNAGDARSTFARLDSDYSLYWGALGKLGEGRALLADGSTGPAREAFNLSKNRAGIHQGISGEAQVGISQCLIADGRYDVAIRDFEQIIGRNPPPEVGGSAWVGKADCLLAQAGGVEGGNENGLKEALIAYLTCTVRYAGTGAYPKALYQAAQILRALNKADQAESLESELRARCPNSEWTGRLGG